MHPDKDHGDEFLEQIFSSAFFRGQICFVAQEAIERMADEWKCHSIPQKFQDGDLVMVTKTGATGFVDETFFDEDCSDLIVRFTNNDMHFQNDLTLLCSVA